MILDSQTKRILLKRLLLIASSMPILNACDFNKIDSSEVVEKITAQLRHHGVAAHLGRLNTQSRSALQSASIDELVDDLLSTLNIESDKMTSTQFNELNDGIEHNIRQDYIQERIVFIDGWLLSQTEALLCVLLFRQIQEANN